MGKFGSTYFIYKVFMGTSPLLWTKKDVYLWENQSLKVKPEQSIDALCINKTYALTQNLWLLYNQQWHWKNYPESNKYAKCV